jgi:diguanylate cyclase (GGDEF)-like protein
MVVALLVVGALYWFALVSLRTSIASTYEQRARSVTAVISNSIQEKDYILYYSDELDADIEQLHDRYETVVGITVAGVSARGFVVVASTDPTVVGVLASEEDQDRFKILKEVEVTNVSFGGTVYLRTYDPIFSGPDLIGIVVVDMSLAEQALFISRLSWQFGVASVVGFFLLGGLLYLALLVIVTKPLGRIAEVVEVSSPSQRIPGTRIRDEVSRLIDGFNLMTKVIHSHEQKLMKLVVLDELTGAYTRDHLRAELDRELAKTRRYKYPTSLLLIDVGGIESRTQQEQEQVLIRTANFLVSTLRNVDVLFRVSDLRFASLLPATPPAGASVAAERLRARVPDVSSLFDFPVVLSISHMGWEGEDAPSGDDVLACVIESLDDPSK